MISFGAKIPIAKCKIQNRETGKFENATVYEYTCTDKSDVEKIERIISKQDWEFGQDIANDVWWKNSVIEKNNTRYNYMRDYHFYSIENNRRKTIGLCETQEKEDISVEFLETLQDKKYRFTGQTLLASVAEKANNIANRLIILNAAQKALDFYRKTCGFTTEIHENDEISFVIEEPQLQAFIKQTEERTNGEIISLNA